MEKRKLSKVRTGQMVNEKIGMEGKRSMMGKSENTMKKEGRNNTSCINHNDNCINNIGGGNNIGCAKYKAGGKDTKCDSSI